MKVFKEVCRRPVRRIRWIDEAKFVAMMDRKSVGAITQAFTRFNIGEDLAKPLMRLVWGFSGYDMLGETMALFAEKLLRGHGPEEYAAPEVTEDGLVQQEAQGQADDSTFQRAG